jgi:hypothetical protein
MDLTPGQRRLLFVVVVIVLAGLGVYLITGAHHGTTAAPAPSPTVTSPTTGAPSASPSASAYVPPTTVPPASPPATTAGGANIYQWLPFSQAGLGAAATTTLAFATDYATWSYTETEAEYGAKLAAVATSHEVATLKFDQYGTAGVAGPMTKDKQVSTGSGAIESINSFSTSPTSITFSVIISQQLASTSGTTTSTPTYLITAVPAGTSWQVDDIQLPGQGNQ